jgi:HEAT repeat protein
MQALMWDFGKKTPKEQIELLESLKPMVSKPFAGGTLGQQSDVLTHVFPVLETNVRDASIWGGLEGGGEKIDVAAKCLDVAAHITSPRTIIFFERVLKEPSPAVRVRALEYAADFAERVWKTGNGVLVQHMKDAFVPIVEPIAAGKARLESKEDESYADAMRFRAIEALGKISAGRTMNTLTNILNDQKNKEMHRIAAAESMLEVIVQHMHTPYTVLTPMIAALAKRALDPNENLLVRDKIISNMWRAGTIFEDDLRELAKDPKVAQKALESLGTISPKK